MWPRGKIGQVAPDLDLERLDSKWGCRAMKSPKWQAEEMRFGPENHEGILSKQMTCLDFIFIELTLAALWEVYQRVAKLDHGRHNQANNNHSDCNNNSS